MKRMTMYAVGMALTSHWFHVAPVLEKSKIQLPSWGREP